MPERLNRILDAIASNNLRIRVDTIDTELLISGFQKVANRITLGLIIAALIIGAALLMRVETAFRIMGYPGFAMLCFLTALLSVVSTPLRGVSTSDRVALSGATRLRCAPHA